ncbi:hypothetical protein BMS3Bbin14_00490 [bacterium BMS3Bbin14]|nr:hypothetical protein BMS3Abin13_01791 [bacterium BMS3Abin13]GBE52032.1 hypothetical protein BMS3Bbin14_00490 [bacterium BMS3Bbin14]
MTKAKNTGLFILLIIQAALIVYLYRPGQGAPPPATLLFSGLRPEMVTSFTITDNMGKTISLAKIKQAWTVGSDGYPGDNDKINNLVRRIAGLKSSRLVSRTRGSHSRLKVGDELFNRKIVLSGPDRKKAVTFFLGTAPSARTIYLRRAGEDDVYEVSGLSIWKLQTDKESWWQRKYVAVKNADLQSLTLTNHGKIISLQRDAKGNWQLAGTPADRKLDRNRVTKLLNSVCRISISGYEGKNFAPRDKAIATITYKTRDKTFKLRIWPKNNKANEQVIKNSQSRFYARLEPYILQDTLELKKSDLLLKLKQPSKQPPAAAEKKGAPAPAQ